MLSGIGGILCPFSTKVVLGCLSFNQYLGVGDSETFLPFFRELLLWCAAVTDGDGNEPFFAPPRSQGVGAAGGERLVGSFNRGGRDS